MFHVKLNKYIYYYISITQVSRETYMNKIKLITFEKNNKRP